MMRNFTHEIYTDRNGRHYKVIRDMYGNVCEKQYIYGYDEFNESHYDEKYNLYVPFKKKETKPRQKTEEELLLEKIKKIKRINDNDVYELIEKIINCKNKSLANSLQEKLEYLGIVWYDSITITGTTDPNQLAKDLIYSFANLNLDSEDDLKKYKFVMTKIKQFEEWEDFLNE